MTTNTHELPTDARRTVIRDITCWKIEAEDAHGGASDEFVRWYIGELADQSDADLVNTWFATVGEWLLSRDDQYVYFEPQGPDAYLEDQFAKLCVGEPTTYGFTADVILPEGAL